MRLQSRWLAVSSHEYQCWMFRLGLPPHEGGTSADRNKLLLPWWGLRGKRKIPMPRRVTCLPIALLRWSTSNAKYREKRLKESGKLQSRQPERGSCPPFSKYGYGYGALPALPFPIEP